MKKLVKRLGCVIVAGIMISALIGSNSIVAAPNLSDTTKMPVKVAVVVYNAVDLYMSEVIKDFKEIQKENEGKVEYTFFSSELNEDLQNRIINSLLEQKHYDLLVVALVNETSTAYEIVNRVKENNIPLIFFHRLPYGKQKEAIRSYEKGIYIGSDPVDGGILQGKLLIDLWNENKRNIDKDGDDVMQYIMLKGLATDFHEIERTRNSIPTANQAGIKTQELASQFADWDKEQGRIATEKMFLKYGDKIEVIVSNNDAMAMGSIQTLQSHGYNEGDKEKTITVIGVDGLPEAIDLINKGYMAGTVIQDAKGETEAIYLTGMNLVNGMPPLQGTPYKFDETGKLILFPYRIYLPS